ncbi:MAG TPA: branched-chain amino acid ABC transporter substrate-binding protein [Candidatus Angelobacter sp.]|nr:branched-chain amino acid ABC transporter substrate-binding protein [Candidatus Angelobacter sp.]
MKRKLLSAVLLSAVALAGCGALAKTAAAEGSDIVIAAAGPMTGDLAVFGIQMRRGAQKAVADINAAGGVLGKQLRLEIGDDGCKRKRAPDVADDLVERGAVFVDGHFCSDASIPASSVYQAAHVLQITPSSSNPALTEDAASKGWKTLFRVCSRDDREGEFAGKWLSEHYRGKRVAIVYERSLYGPMLAIAMRSAMNAGGLSEVLYEGIGPGQRDYSGIVSKLKEANPDAVYFAGHHPEAALIVREMRAQGVQAALFGSDALETNEFATQAGAAADGVMFTRDGDLRDLPTARQVVAALRQEGYEPEGYTLYSYAAVQVWALAAAKAGSTDAAKVADALRSQPWDTVIGTLQFDAKGDPTRQNYVWYVFKNGGYGPAGM